MKVAILLIIFTMNTYAQSFTNARVRLLPPNSPATGVFVDIANPHDYDLTLIGAESSRAKVVELHTHLNEGGVMKMRKVSEITIPAKGVTSLKPGGYHIMLIGLKNPLVLDEKIQIKLLFKENKKEVTIKPKVQKIIRNHSRRNGGK